MGISWSSNCKNTSLLHSTYIRDDLGILMIDVLRNKHYEDNEPNPYDLRYPAGREAARVATNKKQNK